jgi:D-3-phosphoglycerate dehydrogenase
VGTTLGHQHRPHLLEAWGERFNLQLEDDDLAFFRYVDQPGMIGRVGTIFGEAGVNISSAAVGRQAPGDDGRGNTAVMAVTTDTPVPAEVVDRIAAEDGFIAGRAVTL